MALGHFYLVEVYRKNVLVQRLRARDASLLVQIVLLAFILVCFAFALPVVVLLVAEEIAVRLVELLRVLGEKLGRSLRLLLTLRRGFGVFWRRVKQHFISLFHHLIANLRFNLFLILLFLYFVLVLLTFLLPTEFSILQLKLPQLFFSVRIILSVFLEPDQVGERLVDSILPGFEGGWALVSLLENGLGELALEFVADFSVVLIHKLLLLIDLFVLPDHLISVGEVLRLLVDDVVQDSGFTLRNRNRRVPTCVVPVGHVQL